MKIFKLTTFSLFLIFLFCSCKEEQGKLVFYESKIENYDKFINEKEMPLNPNLNVDKVIIDEEYPVEIAIYKDGRFFYNLENLGSGSGVWEHKDGSIILSAKREIFFKIRDMIYKFSILKEDGTQASLEFRDRFSLHQASVKFRNINF